MGSPNSSSGYNGRGDGNNGSATPTLPATPPGGGAAASMLASIASITPPASLTGALNSSPLSPDTPTPLALLPAGHPFSQRGSPGASIQSQLAMSLGVRPAGASPPPPLPLSLAYNSRIGATIPTE